jgi:hypothetical protein
MVVRYLNVRILPWLQKLKQRAKFCESLPVLIKRCASYNTLISLHPVTNIWCTNTTVREDLTGSSLKCAISCHFDTVIRKFVIVLTHHSLKVYGGSERTAPFILNLGTWFKWMVSLTLRPPYSWWNGLQYLWNGGLRWKPELSVPLLEALSTSRSASFDVLWVTLLSPSVAVERLSFLLRVRKVPSSNLGPRTHHPDWEASRLSSASPHRPGKCWGNIS